jgi:hypothetical protein
MMFKDRRETYFPDTHMGKKASSPFTQRGTNTAYTSPHTHTHTPSKKENLGFLDFNKAGKAQSGQASGGLSCSNPKNSQHKKTSIQFFFP